MNLTMSPMFAQTTPQNPMGAQPLALLKPAFSAIPTPQFSKLQPSVLQLFGARSVRFGSLADIKTQLTEQNRMLPLEQALDQLKENLHIAVIYTKAKTDVNAVINAVPNERPWHHYEDNGGRIAEALKANGFQHVTMIADGPTMYEDLKAHQIDLAWCDSGGIQGPNPLAHALTQLESMGVPFIGQSSKTMTQLENKDAFTATMRGIGVPVAPGMTWDPSSDTPFDPATNPDFQKVFAGYEGPFIVKSIIGKSSETVRKVKELKDLQSEVYRAAKDWNNKLVIEKLLPGDEYTVTVAPPIMMSEGKVYRLKGPHIFHFAKRTTAQGEIYDRKNGDKEVPLKDGEEEALKAKMAEYARSVYEQTGIRTYTRFDIRTDANGDPNFIEANAKLWLLDFAKKGTPTDYQSYDDMVLSMVASRVYDAALANARRDPNEPNVGLDRITDKIQPDTLQALLGMRRLQFDA